MENKQAICDALLTTLQLTRRYTETVTVTYNEISHRYINVECDSGIAMINDILKNI